MRAALAALAALATLAACRGERPAAQPQDADTAAVTEEAGECALLTAGDVAEITGTAVEPAARDSAAGADGDCGNYVTPDGTPYVSVSRLDSMADFVGAAGAAPSRDLPLRENLTGVGDEAVMFSSDGPGARRIVARKGERGVVVATFDESVTDDQLQQLAARALERL